MNTSVAFFFRSIAVRAALLASFCALGVAANSSALAAGGQELALQRLADQAPKLPVSVTFEKRKDGGEGPQYTLLLKNNSADALEIHAECELSVTVHAGEKSRSIPAHRVGAGETWSIPDLASLDKVTLHAKGYAPLTVTVP